MSQGWSANRWDGYQPWAKHELMDGVLHIYDVESKHGFGWRSHRLYEAQSGDSVQISAKVKGRGTVAFQLQYFAPDGKKWLGVDPHSSSAQLSDEWQLRSFSLPVSNLDKGATGKFMPTFLGRQGTELFIDDIKIEVIEGKYRGDFLFPMHWQVFIDINKDLQSPLLELPQSLDGKTAQSFSLDSGQISFKGLFEPAKVGNCAWLYAELEAPFACDYSIGAGADYFMKLHVNGETIIDTLDSGNADFPPHFSNYVKTVRLRQGKNIFAVKFLTGGNASPAISLGGPHELRQLSSVLNVTELFQFDDYVSPAQRSGDPQLIVGILTDGMESKYHYGYYKAGSSIEFAGKTWRLPTRGGDAFFATGLRLREMDKPGSMIFKLGEKFNLELQQIDNNPNLQVSFRENEKVLERMEFPKAALPADIILAANHNQYHVNMLSIQDSKLRAFSAAADFSELGEFTSSVALVNCGAAVSNYFTGLAKKEMKSNTVPFKLALDESFDPVKAGWNLIWQDEFNGSEVDWENTWMNSPWNPIPRNREQASVKNGMLHIRCDFSKRPEDSKDKRPYIGKTVGLYSQKRFGYGYYEARLKFTKKPGWWAAFWMFDEGRNMSVGGGYELDIFEDYSTRRGAAVIANNLHVTYGPNMRSYGYHFELPGSLDEFYVIGCKWTPFEFSTYLNGKLVKTSARHSPYNSCTYDAINHGFGTTDLYLSISGQAGNSGGWATGEYSEEYLVDYVRAYEYPRERDPSIRFSKTPPKSVFKSAEQLNFELDVRPSAKSGSPIKTVYLFDGGNLIDYKTKAPYSFSLAIDQATYKDTVWASAGRSGKPANLDSYPHFFRAAVQDEEGMVAYTEIFPVICDMQGGQPYQGAAAKVPGSLKATSFDQGGQNIASYKQERGGFPDGVEKFSRKAMHLREAGEWVNYSIEAEQSGKYQVELERREYRRDEWPMRALLLIDGVYVGDFLAEKGELKAVLPNVSLSKGKHLITLISACSYGVWPESLQFTLNTPF